MSFHYFIQFSKRARARDHIKAWYVYDAIFNFKQIMFSKKNIFWDTDRTLTGINIEALVAYRSRRGSYFRLFSLWKRLSVVIHIIIK